MVTDSTAALPPAAVRRWGICVVPLDVVVDGRRHTEGVDLTPERLLDALRAGAKVSTSQPAPEAFARVYARLAARGAPAVVSVHLSGELSGTVAAARSAAERAPLPVHVVDSRTAAGALGFAALAAAWAATGAPDDERLAAGAAAAGSSAATRPALGARSGTLPAAEGSPSGTLPLGARSGTLPPGSPARPRRLTGAPAAAAASALSALRRLPDALRRPAAPGPDEVAAAARAAAATSQVWFLVDSLEHLRRGGRLSAAAAALGTVLGLRPLLTVSDGRVVVAEKIRTRRAARDRLEAVAVAAAEARPAVRLAVHHLGQPDVAAELAARLERGLGSRAREVVVTEAGAVLGAHAGPGLLAIVVAPA